jgi:glutamyl/glutaminyl-tRNA synthetase
VLRLKNILPELLKRVNVFTEIFDDIDWIVNEDFFCKNNEFYDMLLKNKFILSDISIILNKCLWSKEEIETSLKNYFMKNEIKFKDIGPSLRIALTGKTNSPDIASVIFALGCATSFKRLNYKY